MSSATVRLKQALELAREPPAPISMIAKAGHGIYRDDIMRLVMDAGVAGLHDIRRRAMSGEFDGE